VESGSVSTQYLQKIFDHLQRLHDEEGDSIGEAARMVAEHVKEDKIVYAYGPGGHSNLAPQEIFFRAGGLMHVSAILDEGTLLSNGALRSMAIERTSGYGRGVMEVSRAALRRIENPPWGGGPGRPSGPSGGCLVYC
jgi:uncharacterized phosphosugar-binding protein